MFNKNTQQEGNDRGQVGIGTLIVFIALVLVAAIAAGVLINTAGFLQSQAEQTGQESTTQVANNLEVVSAFGTVDTGTSPNSVTNPTIVVQLAPGSDDIDIGDVQVEVFRDGNPAESSSITGSDIEGGSAVISSGETRTIDLVEDTNIASLGIDEGSEAEVVLVTDDGSTTEAILSPPNPIVDDGGEVRL